MTFHPDKDLKSKHFREKKFLYLPRMLIQKENFKSKPKQFRLENGLFLGVNLILEVETFYKNA